FCVVHRRIVHIPGTATTVPRFITEGGRTYSPEFPAAATDDFLAGPGSVRKRIQEKKTGGVRR
ncbi:MAG: hypothetical protein WAL76_03050, partial [Candidatus Sulfotelmatobacter sp.]